MSKKRAGFTLIELIAATVITAIIVVVISFIINAGMDAWFFLNEQNRMMHDARDAMQRMQREIKRTASSESIATFLATEYAFTDVDGNSINFQKSGTDLERNGAVLLTDLTSADGLEFVYLNELGVVTAATLEISTVQITMKLAKGANQVSLQSSASIRSK